MVFFIVRRERTSTIVNVLWLKAGLESISTSIKRLLSFFPIFSFNYNLLEFYQTYGLRVDFLTLGKRVLTFKVGSFDKFVK